MQRRTFKAALVSTLALAAFSVPSLALAQAWPTKQPIKLVAVFPPGGSVDQVARIIAQPLSQQLAQTVIVENRGGASGTIGTAAVVQAPADGYTFAVVFDTFGVNPSLTASMPFDSKKDLVPLVLVGTSPMVLATNVNSEYKTFADVVAAAKAKKNVSFGTIGNGSLGHLAMALLGKNANVEWTHVPYKGGAQAITDLIGGQVDVMFNGMVATYPQVKAGKIKLIAVSSQTRNAQMPDTPTVAESLPGFLTGSFQGLLAPAGTPKPVIDKLYAEIQRIAALPDVKERLVTLGAEPSSMTPEQFGQWMKTEIPAMAKIVKDEKITAE